MRQVPTWAKLLTAIAVLTILYIIYYQITNTRPVPDTNTNNGQVSLLSQQGIIHPILTDERLIIALDAETHGLISMRADGQTTNLSFPDPLGSDQPVTLSSRPQSSEVFIHSEHLVTKERTVIRYDYVLDQVTHTYPKGTQSVIANGTGDQIAYLYNTGSQTLLATADLDLTQWQTWPEVDPSTQLLSFSANQGIITLEPLGGDQWILKQYTTPNTEPKTLAARVTDAKVSPDGTTMVITTPENVLWLSDDGATIRELETPSSRYLTWVNTETIVVVDETGMILTLISQNGEIATQPLTTNQTLPTNWQPIGIDNNRLILTGTFDTTEFILRVTTDLF